MKKNLELQHSLGIDAHLLDLDQAREIIPFLNTEGLLAVTFHQKDGHLNPFHTTQAYADAFTRLGGEIRKFTQVTGILVQSGRVAGVETTGGDIITGNVINAAGGYAQSINAMAGVSMPLFTERHNILVTEPLEQAMDPMVMSFSLNLYGQQVPHGGFIMGRTCDNQPRDGRITADANFPEEMCRSMTAILPPLRNVRMLRQWAGLYNMSPDKQAVYGPVPEVEGFYVACGFSGHGFMMAPATGRIMAEILLDLPATLPWECLGVDRFEKGSLIMEPSVV